MLHFHYFHYTVPLPPPSRKGMSWRHATDKQQTTGFLSKIEITGCTATITINYWLWWQLNQENLSKLIYKLWNRPSKSANFFSWPVYDMVRHYSSDWIWSLSSASAGSSSSVLVNVLFPSAMVSSAYMRSVLSRTWRRGRWGFCTVELEGWSVGWAVCWSIDSPHSFSGLKCTTRLFLQLSTSLIW